jgi:hypothetical protein
MAEMKLAGGHQSSHHDEFLFLFDGVGDSIKITMSKNNIATEQRE